MKATEILMEEHRVIERVLVSLEKAAKQLYSGKAIPAEFFLKAADFIKGFADGCHHQKEEGVLFKSLVSNGMPEDSGPVAAMLFEHEEGRRFTHSMQDAAEKLKSGDETVIADITKNALEYVALLRAHINKEDSVLFPLSDRVIPVEQHQKISDAFDHIEKEETGVGVHEKYLAIADELEKMVA
ncbi:MAG: hemerythrin domain-containing protein [Ignavibacteria bacterium]|jgi:hemerythrin-like domain-containing protein